MLYIQFGTVIFPGECLSAGIVIAWLVPWKGHTLKKKKRHLLVFFFSKPGKNLGEILAPLKQVFLLYFRAALRSGGWKKTQTS